MEQERDLPVEKYSYLLMRFYDTYSYYYIPKTLLAFYCGSPAPSRRIIIRMTISFESVNDVIIYTLEEIIFYARSNQFIFVAQCV